MRPGPAKSLEVRRDHIAERRRWVRLLLEEDPTMTTEALAERLGWDRSTIRRDRVALGARARG